MAEKQFRILWMCPGCGQEHTALAGRARAIAFANELLEDDAPIVILEDDAMAMLREISERDAQEARVAAVFGAPEREPGS